MAASDQLDLELQPVDEETLEDALERRRDEPADLLGHLPDRLRDAEEIDTTALCREICSSRSTYMLPTVPDGSDGPWFDRLAALYDAAMYVRDGGNIDVVRVIDD